MHISGSHTVTVNSELQTVNDFTDVVDLSDLLGSDVTIRSTIGGSQADWVRRAIVQVS
jgi:hypothetical protein